MSSIAELKHSIKVCSIGIQEHKRHGRSFEGHALSKTLADLEAQLAEAEKVNAFGKTPDEILAIAKGKITNIKCHPSKGDYFLPTKEAYVAAGYPAEHYETFMKRQQEPMNDPGEDQAGEYDHEGKTNQSEGQDDGHGDAGKEGHGEGKAEEEVSGKEIEMTAVDE